MTSPRSMLRAAVLAAPLSALTLNLPAGSAQAADIIDTLKNQQQFSTLAKAIESAGMAQSLQGEGPYTIFAPTDQAFDQLPQDALDSLMQEENRDQLEALLAYHVIEGQEIAAKDALGKQTQLATLAGDSLSVDGTGEMVLLVPAGLTVTGSGDQTETETQVTEGSDMPASEHQQQVMATQPDTERQQTMPQDTAMPASPHQEQVLSGQRESGVLREATVIEPDIQADNGAIHAIDAVLVPQSVLSMLEKTGSQ